jgi:hypothetical protein
METGWPRFFREFLLIVAGVTAALGADSLWSVRQERVRESEYLEQLRADLAENRVRLDAAILDEETLGAAALTALGALERGAPITADSARAWLVERRGFMYSDPRLLTGTFSGLIESGDLRLIQDVEMRKSITAYRPLTTADRVEFDRWVGQLVEGYRAYRPVALSMPEYYTVVGETGAQALSTVPVHPLMRPTLDIAVWTNQLRLIYLRRMLAATEETSAALES